MRKSLQIIFVVLSILILSSCIKTEDPCYGAKHIKADFYMEEVCYGQSCGYFWQDYKTSYSSGGLIRFTSTSITNALPIRPNDTVSYEWHIGAGIYHGKTFELNFGSATDGALIPVMLVIRQRPDSVCITNDTGIDTVIKNLRIDKTTKFCYGSWQGSFSDKANNSATVIIKKSYNFAAYDTFIYILGLEPKYDSVVGSIHIFNFSRQENNFEIDGNGTFNFFGNALTDSVGQNIQITYSYLDTPSYTKKIIKTFKGKRI